jgi:hypothetical protein
LGSQVESTTVPTLAKTAPLAGTASLPAPVPTLTASLAPLDANPQQAALLRYILTELAGMDKQHLLAAQVKANPNDLHGMLDLRAQNLLRAWIYQDGELHDCPADFYTQSYTHEPNGVPIGAWKFAYMAFSLNQVSPDFTQATVRIDRIPGLVGGKGKLLELVRSNGQWSIKSQRNTWIQ